MLRKPSDPQLHALTVALYMNMARCALQQSKNDFALLYCTVLLALLLCDADMAELDAANEPLGWKIKNQTKGYQLRAQAHLNAQHFRKAHKDVEAALKLDPGSNQTQKLSRTITRQQLVAQKADKKLAKEVSKWVQKAMSESEKQGGQ